MFEFFVFFILGADVKLELRERDEAGVLQKSAARNLELIFFWRSSCTVWKCHCLVCCFYVLCPHIAVVVFVVGDVVVIVFGVVCRLFLLLCSILRVDRELEVWRPCYLQRIYSCCDILFLLCLPPSFPLDSILNDYLLETRLPSS